MARLALLYWHIDRCEDESLRYVAEENIMVLEEEPSANLLKLAGRYFKRWDQENKVFISNIKDEYPDDWLELKDGEQAILIISWSTK